MQDYKNFDYKGPPINNSDLLSSLPPEYCRVLEDKNGYICYAGVLHIRGICSKPEWHSLENYWTGKMSLYKLFPALNPTDIPFGENALGDQLILREGKVFYMDGELGELTPMLMDLETFLQKVAENPLEVLKCWPLQAFLNTGKILEPGQLLHAYPLFCTREAANGVTLSAVPSDQQVLALSNRAAFMEKLSKSDSKGPFKSFKKIFKRKPK